MRHPRGDTGLSGEDLIFPGLLSRMDSVLDARGIRRGVGETLTRFSARLEGIGKGEELVEIAAWYSAYARSRYNPASYSDLDAPALEESLAAIELATSKVDSV